MGCTPSNKRFQALYNTRALIKTLSWGGHKPENIYTAVSHWNGGGNLKSDVDFWIKNVGISPDTFNNLDEVILSLESKRDKYVASYLGKIKNGASELDIRRVHKLITQEGKNQKYSNVRGLLAEYISEKRIEEDLGEYGVLMEVLLGAPTITFNGRITYEMDARRQIDLVVSCPDHEDFSKFLGNLKRDKYLEVKLNPRSIGLY